MTTSALRVIRGTPVEEAGHLRPGDRLLRSEGAIAEPDGDARLGDAVDRLVDAVVVVVEPVIRRGRQVERPCQKLAI